MFQMVNAGVRPFGLFPTQLKLAKLMANDNFIDKLPEKISAKFPAVLMGMLNKNVSLRWTIDEILQVPIVNHHVSLWLNSKEFQIEFLL